MRDAKVNDPLLRKIRIDLRCWEEGAKTPDAEQFWMSWMAMLAGGGFLIIHVFRSELLASILAAIFWVALSLWMCKRLFPRYGETWANVLDRRLSMYQPLNLAAWEQLQERVRSEGFSAEVLRSWLQEEAMAVWPEVKPDWTFLHNNPHRISDKEGRDDS